MDDHFAYVGTNPCGCVGTICVDVTSSKEERQRTASRVRDMITRGQIISRVTVAHIRSQEFTMAACTDNPNCVRAKPPSLQSVLF